MTLQLDTHKGENDKQSKSIETITKCQAVHGKEEIHGQERWVQLAYNQDLNTQVENGGDIGEELQHPQFDRFGVPDEVLQFAAFCVSRVATKCDSDLQITSNQIEFFLGRMRNEAGMRTTELIQALALIDIISKQNLDKVSFELTKSNIYLVLLVCVMIAHKSNCDKPYSNGWWGRQFGASLQILNESEVVVLKLLNFNSYVPMSVYQIYHQTIFLAGKQQQSEHLNMNAN